MFDKNKWPVSPSSMAWHTCFHMCVACTCISAYDETPRKELGAAAARRNTVYIMRSEYWRVRLGRACQPASRYRASSNGTDNGEADTHRQHVCRARTKGRKVARKGGEEKKNGRAYSTSSTLAVCWLHLDRSVHL